MLRFGVIGTNFISDWFVGACAGRADVTAVYSRNPDTAKAFASRHGIEKATTKLDEMIAAVDAVYVASPIRAHHQQALTALRAGRHVLVEKTMAGSAKQVGEIQAAAMASGLVAMEAVRNLHTPAYQAIKDALPRLGTLRQADLVKEQYSSRYDAFKAGEVLNAFDPALDNSAIADIGVYPLQPALDLFGVGPIATHGSSVLLDNGFEAAGSLVLGYPDRVATVSWSKITAGVTPSVILGEDGALTIDDIAETSRVTFTPRSGDAEVLFDRAPVSPGETMAGEIESFLAQVDAGASDQHLAALTLASRRIMDAQLAQYHPMPDER
ncbi:Gfo/Idh/MocA family oxidoreductase [Propioniciclava coleopterorum]|uniref:Gfo/Idh/MocA family oxidoreductase n=1 Tax=Propioniciclava coleopterorum TaxID=2714937 RepID=A0A6G7Y5Q2_9ACTN|nr:Gfo/Idh/MocA family oxidoreductase [Propioniciclava coleopterorum]QIK71947.1 Gfo/Idh/MocA family oxidoreductase [Propioniciclava coleopterorum]